jgi:hypothetical protein
LEILLDLFFPGFHLDEAGGKLTGKVGRVGEEPFLRRGLVQTYGVAQGALRMGSVR